MFDTVLLLRPLLNLKPYKTETLSYANVSLKMEIIYCILLNFP